MKTLIIANWKLNPTDQKDAKTLFDSVKKGIKNAKHVEVVICPPFVYLSLFEGLTLGAQNVFYKEQGAFTGEISPLMLKNLGVEYVIIGHSEVRNYFHDTDEIINKKIKGAILLHLHPILCVGENEEENKGGKKAEILETQLTEGLKGVSAAHVKDIAIAYEPVWAIGTGNNCSVDETMSSVLLIKKIISNLYHREVAEKMRILYGGSVKAENAADYLKNAGVNGLLVGGASLKSEEFIQIVMSAM